MKECTIEGCQHRLLARGWCAMHYARWQKTGDPLGLKGHGPGHVLSDIDTENMKATCERCGRVDIVRRTGKQATGYRCVEVVRRRTWFNMIKMYGLTPEDYTKLLDKQNNECAICATSFKVTRPCIDHCHETGRVRGVLCIKCNLALGTFGDNVKGIKKVLEYLLRSEQ